MHEKHEKTNAMRQLDRKKAAYTVHSYDGGALSGTEVASALGKDPAHCFKTLVTVGKTGGALCLYDPPSRLSWTCARRRPPRAKNPSPCSRRRSFCPSRAISTAAAAPSA